MDRSADNLGQVISGIQRDLEELKSSQGSGSGGGGGGGGEEYYAGDGITISNNTISADTNVLATKEDLTDYAELSDLATVATSGSYNDLLNKPTIPDPTDYYWANVKVSSSSSNYAKPSFDQTTYPNSTYPHIIGNGSLLYMSADGNASGGYNIVLDKNQPSFRPTNASSGLLDLGKSYSKWKDLYLAGDLYLPGDIKKGDYTISFQNKSGTLALTSDVDSKVDIQSVVLDNQTTTILAQVKALGAAKKSYGRFTCTYDGASANISDKPTGSTNASFVCVAYASRLYSTTSYTYQLLCWVQNNTNPFRASVEYGSNTIQWSRVIPTVNDGTLTIQKNGTNVATFTANQSTAATANITVPTKTSDLTNDGSDGNTTYVEATDVMTGASSSTAGTGGLVPAPSAGDQEKYLRGDGTWQPAGSSSDIPDGAVTTPKLASKAVTTAKIDDGAVTNAQIANSTIAATKINWSTFKYNFTATTDGAGFIVVPTDVVNKTTGFILSARCPGSRYAFALVFSDADTNNNRYTLCIKSWDMSNVANQSVEVDILYCLA